MSYYTQGTGRGSSSSSSSAPSQHHSMAMQAAAYAANSQQYQQYYGSTATTASAAGTAASSSYASYGGGSGRGSAPGSYPSSQGSSSGYQGYGGQSSQRGGYNYGQSGYGSSGSGGGYGNSSYGSGANSYGYGDGGGGGGGGLKAVGAQKAAAAGLSNKFAKYDGRKRTFEEATMGDRRSGPSDAKRGRGARGGGGGLRGSRGGGFGGGRGGGFGGGRGGGFGRGRGDFDRDPPIDFNNVLTSKKFNFWNLPSKARVLIVSQIPLNIAQPRNLFNLFSLFGDVVRVKILRNKLSTALVEFSTATFAMIARNHMDQCPIDGGRGRLTVSFARFDRIKTPRECNAPDDGYTQDFTGSSFQKLHRFNTEALMKVNLKRVCSPTSTIHVTNIPSGVSANDLCKLFESNGVQSREVLAMKMSRRNSSNLMVFMDLASNWDSVIAVALMNGQMDQAVNMGLRVSFVESTLEQEKAKAKEPGGPTEVVANTLASN